MTHQVVCQGGVRGDRRGGTDGSGRGKGATEEGYSVGGRGGECAARNGATEGR